MKSDYSRELREEAVVMADLEETEVRSELVER